VFYAGRSFTAIPAKRNVKQLHKDEQRLRSLSSKRSGEGSAPLTRFGITVLPPVQKPATNEQRDAERLLKLQKGSEESSCARGSTTDDAQSVSGTESVPRSVKVEGTAQKMRPFFPTAKESETL
jgi:hypothetical protein